jgi:hypothetical protein
MATKINKPYKGSFCHTQKGPSKESTNEGNSYSKDYKTPLKTSKISMTLTKPDKTSLKEPLSASISHDIITAERVIAKTEKPEFFHNRPLLSSKMFNQTMSMNKSSNIGSKEKVKTSLEIYSNTIRLAKGNF